MIGQTASRYPTKRLKHVVSLRQLRANGNGRGSPYVGLENIESWTGKLVDGSSSTTEDTVQGNVFSPGDVLFGKLRPYLAKVWVAEFAGRSTTECLVMKPAKVESRFLGYACLSQDFIEAVDASTFGSKMPRAEWGFIGNMPIPVPRRHEQRAVADYLDRETARLDALVTVKERMLELLTERRQTIITVAVTGDVNSAVRQESSPANTFLKNGGGNEAGRNRKRDHPSAVGDDRMIGQTASRYPTKRLKHVVSLRQLRANGNGRGSPYVGLENIESWTGKLVDGSSSTTEDTVQGNVFSPGDVLFGKLRPYLAKVWVAEFAGRSTTECLVMKPAKVESRFLGYACLSQDFIEAVDASTFGSKMPRAEWGFIGNMPIPVPRRHEQRAVADYLDRETARLDALTVKIQSAVALLKERRASLIAAAVAGRIDVERPA